MARATRPTPAAATRLGGTTIAPASSAVLVIAIAIALGLSFAVAAVAEVTPARDGRTVGGSGRPVAAPAAATGVPAPSPAPRASVPDVPWLAERGDGIWLYGRGAEAHELPHGEFGIAIDDDFIATTSPGPAARSTVHLRIAATGARVRDVAAPIWVSAGAWTTAGLVVTGYRDSSMRADGGLVLVTRSGTTEVLVPGGPFPAGIGTRAARGDVLVSPSGGVVASNLCGVELCDRQVVDLATRAVVRPRNPVTGFLRALTDDLVITTDQDARWISAGRWVDGREAWRLTDQMLLDPAVAAGTVIGVFGSSATGWGVDRVDQAGSVTHLTPRARGDAPSPRIWSELSKRNAIVVGHGSFGEAIGNPAGVDVNVLTLDRGQPIASKATFALSLASEAAR